MANTERKSATPSKRKSAKKSVDSLQRHDMIAEAAYLMAEQRGFEGEAAMDDWLKAESEVDMKLAAKV